MTLTQRSTPREILWLERAAELAEAANRALRASHECLREAEQARLAAERDVSAPRIAGGGLGGSMETRVGAETPFSSPFAGRGDPGALPGALGSPQLRSVG